MLIFFCVLRDYQTAFVSSVLGVMFSNRCSLFFCVQFLHFLVACLLDLQLERSSPVAPAIVLTIFMVENVPFSVAVAKNRRPVNMIIFVIFRRSMWLQIRTFVCFRHLRFQVLLLVLNRDRYFHLFWRQFGMSNSPKRGHSPPRGDTPG